MQKSESFRYLISYLHIVVVGTYPVRLPDFSQVARSNARWPHFRVDEWAAEKADEMYCLGVFNSYYGRKNTRNVIFLNSFPNFIQ